MQLKVFAVNMLYKNAELSMLITYGGSSGRTHKRIEFVAASSPEEAVSVLWEKVLEKSRRQRELNREVMARSSESGPSDVDDLLLACEDIPVDQEKWEAKEVKIDGFTVIAVKDEGREPQEVPQTHKKWWQKLLGR